ncbi:MAG TPA: ribonuclease BN, partial [Thermodesulfovibrionia bacterium]|nr:ribonuclease BN [Thermodesulfovibrionia bacterium]
MAHDIIEQLRKRIWDTDVNKLSKPQGILIKVIRAAYLIGQDAASGHLTMWAMSLVYTTLLSLVPFLAVTFSVLKAFGVQREIESALYGFLLTP